MGVWVRLQLPWVSVPEVREGLVRLGHLVGVFLALDERADTIGCVHQLRREFVGHALATAPSRVADDPAAVASLTAVEADITAHFRLADDPAAGQRLTASVPGLDGHVVRGTADALWLDLEDWRDVANRL